MTYNYPPYNPYNQMQMQQLYQNQMMMQPPAQMPQAPVQSVQTAPQTAQGISASSRPVTNREEAVSTPADFGGALMLFPDITHNRVYLKRWNVQTGNADFVEYAPVIPANAEPQTEQSAVAFASLQDFQDLQETVTNLQEEIDRMKRPTQNGKVGKKNDSSDE